MEVKPRPKPRVVVTEDNDAMRQFICNILRPQYNVVAVASDGRSAINTVLKLRPDVLILEVLLPILDGIQVVRRLHVLKPACKVLMLSGLESPEYVDAAMEAGADGFVFKRNIGSDLLRAIGEVMAGRTFVSKNPSQ